MKPLPKLDDPHTQAVLDAAVEKVTAPDLGAKLDTSHTRAFVPSEDESDEGEYFRRV